jgi:hypothetical protein
VASGPLLGGIFGLAFARESENIRLDPNAWLNTWTQLINGSVGVIFILDDNHGFIGGLKYTRTPPQLKCFGTLTSPAGARA